MRVLPWILGGGAALGFYYWGRRSAEAPDTPSDATSPALPQPAPGKAQPPAASSTAAAEPLPGRWVWPVGVWRGRKPEISDGFSSTRRSTDGTIIRHGGVDLMYRRQPGDPWGTHTPNGTPHFVMPDGRPALAASDGVVWFAANTPRGWSVIVDHSPRKLTTYYTHLSSLLVAPKAKVSAGAPIGIIGADPLDGEHIMHLHFEVRRGGADAKIDPAPLMPRWEYLPDPVEPAVTLVARNARPAQFHADRVPVREHSRSSLRR